MVHHLPELFADGRRHDTGSMLPDVDRNGPSETASLYYVTQKAARRDVRWLSV
ncbi:MAG: hypothetical protein K2H75_02850 [Muribaculaceae bacterium]|nr:hypothetical protein [Muribaculaceae bacterium]